MAGAKDITIKLKADATGVGSAFKSAEQVAGRFKGTMDQFARQYRSTMAAAFDKGAAERMAQNLFGSIEGMKDRLMAQARQMKGLFSDAAIVGVQGKFKASGADEGGIKRGTSAAFNMAAATGESVDKIGVLLAKSLQGANKELSKLVPEVAKLTVEELKAGAAIDLVAKKYEGFGDKANAAVRKAELTSKLKATGEKMASVGRSMSMYLTAPLAAAATGGIKYAGDLNESLNKVDVAFGKHASVVKTFSDNSLKAFGISKGSALDMSATYGDMATSMGLNTAQAAKMGTTLVGLAGDMSSFKNIPLAETSQALTAIFTGETESLKRMGVVMTETNLQAFALSKGIKTKVQNMSEGEKVMLRYQYVLEKTKNSHGDFARTSTGAANQQRIFTEGVRNLAASFGQVLIPIWEKFLGLVNKLVAWLSGLSTTTKTILVTVAALAAGVGPLLAAIGLFTGTILPALIAGGAAISTAWAPVTAVVLALAGAFAYFSIKSKKAQEQVDKLAQSKYYKPMLDERNSNTKRIKELEEKKKHTGIGYSLNGVYQNPSAGIDDEIRRLKERNQILYKALMLKKEHSAEDAEAAQKAKDMTEAMNAQMTAANSNAQASKETIHSTYQKFVESKTAIDNQLKNGVVGKRAYYAELQSLADQYYKKVGEFAGAAGGKELKALQQYIEKTRAYFKGEAMPALSEGPRVSGDITPTKKANKGDAPTMKVGNMNFSAFEKSKQKILELRDLMASVKQGIMDMVATTVEGIGTMFGQLARGDGKNALKTFISSFVNMVGDFAIQMGKQLLAVGVGLIAFKASLSSMNGYLALAAGAALIVAGAAFKAFVGGGIGGGGSSSSGGGGHEYIGRTTARGAAATATTTASQVNVVGELKLQMGELKASLKTIDKQAKYA